MTMQTEIPRHQSELVLGAKEILCRTPPVGSRRRGARPQVVLAKGVALTGVTRRGGTTEDWAHYTLNVAHPSPRGAGNPNRGAPFTRAKGPRWDHPNRGSTTGWTPSFGLKGPQRKQSLDGLTRQASDRVGSRPSDHPAGWTSITLLIAHREVKRRGALIPRGSRNQY